ncbi:class I SAM-dependent RNA methyltransferase [Phyllobacterium sp. YR531]|uniref:class I SAM-dependent RNA methyltransferase n=1 Tax=Phyllobacterium sp. YR531 TaxID=1144343 RepID=UPI00026FC39D|nr:class I SAM-dependent RNA methyltransferase [Phyllobacterium sp. YR531]EJN03007.1 SAM-dependent methyltransferase, tRNA(uracil-5)-methyltransferase [Phyllobacterium sp. YR531]
MSTRVIIERMGAGGDGIAATAAGSAYVPFSLPGEVANVALENGRATMMALLEPSPERVAPSCRHFEECGGCTLQHWQDSAYQEWKRSLVQDALGGRGLVFKLDPLVPCLPETRRRTVFAVRTSERGAVLGFNRHLSHELIDIAECPITVPEIVSRLDDLRDLVAVLGGGMKPFKLTVTSTASGLDITASGCGAPDAAKRQALTALVIKKGFARLSFEGEIIVEPRKPLVHFGKVPVFLPPGGFLQATADAEEAMCDLVTAHLAKAKKTLDLFCGSGTFAFRIAEKSSVHAVENDQGAVAAIDRSVRYVQGLKPVSVERRDLFRRPFLARELAPFNGLVFDPPRAGAEAQAIEIAKSSVSKVAAVSCNPVTLARDLSILVKGGYKIDRVVPIDQFLWSSHVEAVALLSKK